MLSSSEKRFVRYWQEQRTGGMASYYLMYVLIGTIMVTLFTSIVLHFFLHYRFAWILFITVVVCSLLASAIVTYVTWRNNERKFKDLIRREIRESAGKEISGESFDDQRSS
jgi:uncharacterized membrane protein